MDALFTIKKFHNNSILETKQSIPSISKGITDIFSSDIYRNGIYMIQIFLAGNITNIDSISLILIENTSFFIKFINKIQQNIFYLSIFLLIIYSLSLLLEKKFKIQIRHLLTLISIIFLIISSYPNFKFRYNTNIFYCLSISFKGILTSYNLYVLFLTSYSLIGGDSFSSTFIIFLMFIISESMKNLTSDTMILIDFFDNNGIIWVFFFCISIISKVLINFLIIYYLIYSFYINKNLLIILYFIGSLFSILPEIIQILLFIFKNFYFKNIKFFTDLLIGLFLTLFFIIINWPTQNQNNQKYFEDDLNLNSYHFPRDHSLPNFENNFEES